MHIPIQIVEVAFFNVSTKYIHNQCKQYTQHLCMCVCMYYTTRAQLCCYYSKPFALGAGFALYYAHIILIITEPILTPHMNAA